MVGEAVEVMGEAVALVDGSFESFEVVGVLQTFAPHPQGHNLRNKKKGRWVSQ